MKGFPATSIRVDCVIEPFTSRHIRSGCSCQGGASYFFLSLLSLSHSLPPAIAACTLSLYVLFPVN